MKNIFTGFILSSALLLTNCSVGQNQEGNYKLSAADFKTKMETTPLVTLLDVRTSEEFSKGHLKNAVNIDWNNNNTFEQQIDLIDKDKPVLVYCLSGGRSAAAASEMRTDGFNEVYELDGGIMKWRAAGFPEAINPLAAGISRQQFDEMLTSDKLVLVDFYADWCASCKKMEPFMKEIAADQAKTVLLIRFNADDNQSLVKDLKLDGLPAILIYKAKELQWQHIGFISKEDLLKQLQ